MPKFYVRWQMNPKETFKTSEERAKLVSSLLERIKEDFQAGLIKDWGLCVDRSDGYAIFEVASETDLFNYLNNWAPHVNFDARQVINIDQAIETNKQAALEANKQT